VRQAILTLSNVQSAKAGAYSVTITGTCNNITSNTVNLIVNEAVVFTAQPTSVAICAPNFATLTVTATGTNPIYKWFNNGAEITGATSNIYTTTTSGNYYAVVSNACTSITSALASVTNNTAAAIVTQPAAITTCAGTSASFSINATGTNITYQWYGPSGIITGATSSIY
jgi:hypothetical protein